MISWEKTENIVFFPQLNKCILLSRIKSTNHAKQTHGGTEYKNQNFIGQISKITRNRYKSGKTSSKIS